MKAVCQLAHTKVRNAILRGTLTRKPCESCGNEITQAHHDDYSKPLEVRWLCPSCHRRFHNSNRHLSEFTDPYASKRHKFYMSPELADAICALAKLDGISASELISGLVIAELKANAVRLRKAGYKLPEELFKK